MSVVPEEVFELGFELESFGGRLLDGGTITSVTGIEAGVGAAGMRRSKAPDVALIAVEGTGKRACGTGVFTANKAKAAPVLVSMGVVESGSSIEGIVANAGCANALTGEKGLEDAKAMQRAAAHVIGANEDCVLVASTGIIGTFLPIEAVTSAINAIAMSSSEDAGHQAARAIMTTDRFPKECAVGVESIDGTVTVGAIAKGAAMLEPAMATMLAFVATDAFVDPNTLRRLLRNSVSKTFNKMSVDACMSTNDCVLAVATGEGPSVKFGDAVTSAVGNVLQKGLDFVCAYLALEMARDGEGSNRLAVLRIRGAASQSDAERVARAIASSTLVRCSLYGGDPYWGRIVAEAGSVARYFDSRAVSVWYGPFEVCRNGVATSEWHSNDLSSYMSSSEVEIVCDLGMGPFGTVRVIAALGPGYVEENMATS
ncbi:MAG: ornithine acetyltransferase [Acidimicrobiia bacterium]